MPGLVVDDLDIAIATTEDVETEHTALDVYEGVAVDCTISATAVDAVPNVWYVVAILIQLCL